MTVWLERGAALGQRVHWTPHSAMYNFLQSLSGFIATHLPIQSTPRIRRMSPQRHISMVLPPWCWVSYPGPPLAFQGSKVGHEAKDMEEGAKILLETLPSFLLSTPLSAWPPTWVSKPGGQSLHLALIALSVLPLNFQTSCCLFSSGMALGSSLLQFAYL